MRVSECVRQMLTELKEGGKNERTNQSKRFALCGDALVIRRDFSLDIAAPGVDGSDCLNEFASDTAHQQVSHRTGFWARG
jgi:hypothetical protein